MTLAFLVTIVVSKLDNSASAAKERDSFEDQNVRSQTGIGAAAAVSH
jgi:cation/acetate symporter